MSRPIGPVGRNSYQQPSRSIITPNFSFTNQNSRYIQGQAQAAQSSGAGAGAGAANQSVGANGAGRKRKGFARDGAEPWYLDPPSPNNRLVLALRSGLPSQIDWSLSRLLEASSKHTEHLIFEKYLGLIDGLLSFVQRLCSAIAGEPEECWEERFFEIDQDQGLRDKRARISEDGDRNLNGVDRDRKFNPAQIKSHQNLLRRALEASLILRNCCTFATNSRFLLSNGSHFGGITGMISLVKKVLDLNDLALENQVEISRHGNLELELEIQGNLEIEGLNEIRNHWLEILEGFSSKMYLSKRGNFGIREDDGGFVDLMGQENESTERISESFKKLTKGMNLRPQDSIFLKLLNYVHHSKDLALVLPSLRILTILAGSERNEAAFVEETSPIDIGESELGEEEQGKEINLLNPGLIQKCIQFLTVQSDPELLEVSLDLFYQIIGISNNGLKLVEGVTSLSSSTSRNSSIRSSLSSASHSLIRSLVKNLNHQVTKWPREYQMISNPKAKGFTPDPSVYRGKVEREKLEAKEMLERDLGEMGFTGEEIKRLKGLTEPLRCETWLKETLQVSPMNSLPQIQIVQNYMNFFTPPNYNHGLNQNTIPPGMLTAQEVMKALMKIFPDAKAHQVPMGNQPRGQWMFRGIERRVRKTEPFHCQWPTCHSPGTSNYKSLKNHIVAHVSCSQSARCNWMKTCSFVVPGSETLEIKKVRDLLLKHALTHLPEDTSSTEKAKESKETKTMDIVKYSRSSGLSTQDKGRLPIVLGDGTRTLALESDPFLSSTNGNVERVVSSEIRLKNYLKGSRTPLGTGTIDKPGKVSCFVSRTPMDNNELPIGIAGTSALILRSLARISGSILDKSGIRPKVERVNKISEEKSQKSKDAQSNKKIDYENLKNGNEDVDLFGFPSLPPIEDEKTGFGEETNGINNGGISSTSVEPWTVEAASIIMDAINSVEEDLVGIVGSNDVLCKPLNLALAEMRP